MKKLREELESSRSSEGESRNELIIRCIRGAPKIVSKNDRPKTHDVNIF